METKMAKEDIKPGIKMYVENMLIKRYLHRPHRLLQRICCTGTILILFVSGSSTRPHRPDNRTKSSELHRQREMDHFIWTLFVSDSRMTRRQVRKLRMLQVALDDMLDCEVSVVERLFPVRETMTSKVYPLALSQLFHDPGNARFLPFHPREDCKTIDPLTNIGKFATDGNEFTFTGGLRLTNAKKVFSHR